MEKCLDALNKYNCIAVMIKMSNCNNFYSWLVYDPWLLLVWVLLGILVFSGMFHPKIPAKIRVIMLVVWLCNLAWCMQFNGYKNDTELYEFLIRKFHSNDTIG